ncbi:MAG: hypothetical protein PHI63_06715 [Patescibacteria group bacterium]|nr:hypothetical protein [Patescibacteria group bacterium]
MAKQTTKPPADTAGTPASTPPLAGNGRWGLEADEKTHSVTVLRDGARVRTYTLELHGAKFAELAQQFVNKQVNRGK